MSAIAVPAVGFQAPSSRRLAGAVRYAGVLAVWLGLLAVRPRLALQVMRERRPDSPIPRRRRPGSPGVRC